MSEEFLCIRCSRHQRTCCQDSEIYVTLGDVRRIAPHTENDDFTEFRLPGYPVYDQQVEDPFWHKHVFRPDGTRRILKHQPNGNCIFLGEAGCRLPAEDRPLVCRLYPFDYTADGILERLASGCPVELLSPQQPLLTALGMTVEDARPLHNQLYHEMCETSDAAET